MTRYVGVFVADTAPRIRVGTMYELSDQAGVTTKIGVAPYPRVDELGTPYPAGALIEIESPAKDLDDAVAVTTAIADAVVVLLNLATPGFTTFPHAEVVYAVDGPIPRPAYFFTAGWTPGPRTQDLDHALFEQLLRGMFSLAEEPMWRTSHAGNNFRLALQDPDPAMRVPTTYAGLEFLNPLLDPTYGSQYTGPGQSKGVGGYFESEHGATFEAKARGARNGIVHGKQAISDLASDLNAIDTPVLESLRKAIIAEIGVTAAPWTAPADINAPGRLGDARMTIVGEMTPNGDGDVAPVGYRHPVVILEGWGLTASHVDPDGTYHAEAKPKLRMGLADGATLHISQVRVTTAAGVDVQLSNPTVGH